MPASYPVTISLRMVHPPMNDIYYTTVFCGCQSVSSALRKALEKRLLLTPCPLIRGKFSVTVNCNEKSLEKSRPI